MALKSFADLRTIYRPAQGVPLDKVIAELDEHCVAFLAKSPFMVLSTADENGVVDGSPKGGEPGFAWALPDGRVAWADSAGNNRLDSFENVVRNPSVALLFMIPGLNETLRINGEAQLLTDPELCEEFALNGRPAKVVVAVTVSEAYVHCAKAFRRSKLWEPESWQAESELPNAVEMLCDHAAIDDPLDTMSEAYEAAVAGSMWTHGGDDEEVDPG